MDYEETIEGETVLLAPVSDTPRASDEVFYNPAMQLNRDLSIAFVKAVEASDFLDLLAASGARGIRVAKEAGTPVTLNDANPKACSLILENAKANGVEVEVTNLNHRRLLAGRRFGFIDIDPFGPPIDFIEPALSAISSKGYLAVTATDTSALCGSYPKACMRKYGAQPIRTDCYDELGLRILLGYVARKSLEKGYGAVFKFSHSSRHYMRTYLQVNHGSKSKRQALENLGYLQYCFNCLKRKYAKLDDMEGKCACGTHYRNAGPLWTGKTADEKTCGRMLKTLLTGEYGTRRHAVKLVEKVVEEQAITLPYYNIHKAYKKQGREAEKTEKVLENIRRQGYGTAKTHYNPLGIKTDIPDIKDAITF